MGTELKVRLDANSAVTAAKRLGGSLDEVGAKSRKASQGLDTFDSGTDRIYRSALKLAAPLAALFSVRAVFNWGRSAVTAFGESEDAVASLRATLGLAGEEGETAIRKIADEAARLQRITKSEDDALIGAVARLKTLAPALQTDELVRAERALIAIAEITGGDLDSAAQALGKTLGGTTNALARYGIEVEKGASSSEKLAQIIGSEKLGAAFDVAQAKAQTFEGRLEQLRNATGDLNEEFGGIILEALGLARAAEDGTDRVFELTDAVRESREEFIILGRVLVLPFQLAANSVQTFTDIVLASTSGMVGGVLTLLNKVGLGPDAGGFLTFARASAGEFVEDIKDIGRAFDGLTDVGPRLERSATSAFEDMGEGADTATEAVKKLTAALDAQQKKLDDILKSSDAYVSKFAGELLDRSVSRTALSGPQEIFAAAGRGESVIPRPGAVSSVLKGEFQEALADYKKGLSEGTRSGLSQGFDATKGKLSEMLKSALDPSNIGAGIANFIGGAVSGGVASLASAAVGFVTEKLGSFLGDLDLFGSGAAQRDRERAELQERNTDALTQVAKNLEDFGAKLAGMTASQVTAFRDVLDYIKTGRSGGAAGIGSETLQGVGSFFGLDLSKGSIPQELLDQLGEQIVAALAKAAEQIQAKLSPDFAARAAALGGDDLGAAQIRREAAAAIEIKQLQDFAAAGFISADQLREWTGVIEGELAKALSDATAASEAAAAALAKQAEQQAFELAQAEANLEVRKLIAAGLTEEGEALQRELERREEYRAALEQFGQEFADSLKDVQAAEEARFLADAAAELARSLAAAAAASATLNAEMQDDLAVRRLMAQGLGKEADILRQQIDQQKELAAAISGGVSEALLEELRGVQGLERDALLKRLAEEGTTGSGGGGSSAAAAGNAMQGLTGMTQGQAFGVLDVLTLISRDTRFLRPIEMNTRRGGDGASAPSFNSIMQQAPASGNVNVQIDINGAGDPIQVAKEVKRQLSSFGTQLQRADRLLTRSNRINR